MRSFLSVFVLPLIGFFMQAGVATLDAMAKEPPVPQPVIAMATVPTVTTTTALPSPVTTALPPKRASRSDAGRTPPVRPAPVAAVDPGDDCMSGWTMRDWNVRVAKAHRCWDHLITAYPWDHTRAFRIMLCESGGNPLAANRSGARGLMQILSKDKNGNYVGSFDPATNMAQAWEKYAAARGWSPWVCR